MNWSSLTSFTKKSVVIGLSQKHLPIFSYKLNTFFKIQGMNFNQWYILHFVQWPFSIFLVTSWFHAHRTSSLYQQKTEPIAISQLHHHWIFYNSRSSAEIKINSNLMVPGQGYMVDVTSLPNQALIFFGEWLKMCLV